MAKKNEDPKQMNDQSGDEIEPTEQAAEPSDETIEEASTTLETKLRSLEDDIQALKDENLRLISEMRNESQRNREYTDRLVKNANQSLVQELIPVLDAMDAGLSHSQESDHVLYKGLEMTQSTLIDILKKSGVHTICPEIGTIFNPDEHEAMGMTASEEHPEQAILSVLQNGYKIHDRVIRAAKVMIASA